MNKMSEIVDKFHALVSNRVEEKNHQTSNIYSKAFQLYILMYVNAICDVTIPRVFQFTSRSKIHDIYISLEHSYSLISSST